MKEQNSNSPSVTNNATHAASATATFDDLLASPGGVAWRRLLAQGQPAIADLAELLKALPQAEWSPILLEVQHDPRLGNSFVQQAVQLAAKPASADEKQDGFKSRKHRDLDNLLNHDRQTPKQPIVAPASPSPSHRGDGEKNSGNTLGFGATEHQSLGAEASNTLIVELATGYSIPYGDMAALAADHFESVDQMRQFAANSRGGKESRAEIEYARYWKLGVKTEAFDSEAKRAQEGRYATLAAKNRRHFVNPKVGDAEDSKLYRTSSAPDPELDKVVGEFHVAPDLPSAIAGYRYYHLRALATAAKAGADGQGLSTAYAEESFGDHFMTDSFSAGHIRTQRDDLQTYWNAKFPMFFYNLKGTIAETMAQELAPTVGPVQLRAETACWLPYKGAFAKVSQAFDSKPKIGLGDLLSVAVHNYDNVNGVNVESEGKEYQIFGDGHLAEGDTRALALQSVKVGLQEIQQAYAHGKAGLAPRDAIAAVVGQDKLFGAERMVPKALPDNKQGVHQDTKSGQLNSRQMTPWKFDSLEGLLANAQVRESLRQFAIGTYDDLAAAASDLSEAQQATFKARFLNVLAVDPTQMVRTIVNWTPSLKDSLGGRNTDDNANDYWKEVKSKKGGLHSLTYTQRERLIGDLLGGAVIGSDEDAIMDLLRTAPQAATRSLIAHFGWSKLHDKIDNGPGNEFADRFPKSTE